MSPKNREHFDGGGEQSSVSHSSSGPKAQENGPEQRQACPNTHVGWPASCLSMKAPGGHGPECAVCGGRHMGVGPGSCSISDSICIPNRSKSGSISRNSFFMDTVIKGP